MNQPRVSLGRVVITANAAAVLNPADVTKALVRHRCGDWGEFGEEDRLENERSLHVGWRLMSVYTDSAGRKFWIITEADRSSTCILLPEDY